MKAIVGAAVLCVLCMQGEAFGTEKQTLAVLYFENNSMVDKDELEPLRKGLAEMLITELSHIEAFHVIERARLQELLKEVALGLSGALDPVTEQRIDQNIRRRGCTCIIAAHRLSTIRDADKILVINDDEIIEGGTHAELVAQQGFYHNLYRSQFKGQAVPESEARLVSQPGPASL